MLDILLGPHEDYNAQPHSKVYVKVISTVLGSVYERVRLHVILDPMLRTYTRKYNTKPQERREPQERMGCELVPW